MQRSKQRQNRLERQWRIDQQIVAPVWDATVHKKLIGSLDSLALPRNATLLMPEVRMPSLLNGIHARCPRQTKFMVVDQNNSRFDLLRQHLPQGAQNVYFSAQLLNALNYSQLVFDALLTQISLSTLQFFPHILVEYHRILKKDATMVLSSPMSPNLAPFIDLLEESLLKQKSASQEAIMKTLREHHEKGYTLELLEKQGFRIQTHEEVSAHITFPQIEDFLFSTLIESYYLSTCLSILPLEDGKKLLTKLVKAFHHYYQGQSMQAEFRHLHVVATKV